MKYAFIPKPRHKKGTSRMRRRMLQRRLEDQFRNWCGPGATKNAEYLQWAKTRCETT